MAIWLYRRNPVVCLDQRRRPVQPELFSLFPDVRPWLEGNYISPKRSKNINEKPNRNIRLDAYSIRTSWVYFEWVSEFRTRIIKQTCIRDGADSTDFVFVVFAFPQWGDRERCHGGNVNPLSLFLYFTQLTTLGKAETTHHLSLDFFIRNRDRVIHCFSPLSCFFLEPCTWHPLGNVFD